jgi:hypothetical protein
MRAMDDGRLPAEWSRRISAANVRISQGCWALKAAGAVRGMKAPSYWGRPDSGPPSIGPRAVVYPGVTPPSGGFADGIGSDGHWIPVLAP